MNLQPGVYQGQTFVPRSALSQSWLYGNAPRKSWMFGAGLGQPIKYTTIIGAPQRQPALPPIPQVPQLTTADIPTRQYWSPAQIATARSMAMAEQAPLSHYEKSLARPGMSLSRATASRAMPAMAIDAAERARQYYEVPMEMMAQNLADAMRREYLRRQQDVETQAAQTALRGARRHEILRTFPRLLGYLT